MFIKPTKPTKPTKSPKVIKLYTKINGPNVVTCASCEGNLFLSTLDGMTDFCATCGAVLLQSSEWKQIYETH
jgi:hypothetical protein